MILQAYVYNSYTYLCVCMCDYYRIAIELYIDFKRIRALYTFLRFNGFEMDKCD